MKIYWPIRKGLIFLSSIPRATVWSNYHNLVGSRQADYTGNEWNSLLSFCVGKCAACLSPDTWEQHTDLAGTSCHWVTAQSHVASEFSLVSVEKVWTDALWLSVWKFHILFLDTRPFILKSVSASEALGSSTGVGTIFIRTNIWKKDDRARPRCWGALAPWHAIFHGWSKHDLLRTICIWY